MTDKQNSLPRRMRELVERAAGLSSIPVAVVDAAEEHVIVGACEASRAGLIDPILIGHRPDIERVMAEQGLEKDAYPIVEAESELEAAELGVQKVLDGQAAALMKGWIHTDVLLHPVLTHLRTARRVSHIFVVELASYPKLLFVTDAAINIVPDLMTKAAIV